MAGFLASGRGTSGDTGAAVRPFSVSAALAGAVSAVSVLLACLLVSVGGWLASGDVARGSTSDAFRVGADAWLLGQGAPLDLADAHISVIPLGITALCALVCYRSGRWAGLGAAARGAATGWLSAVVLAVVYGVVAAVTAGAASTAAVHPHPVTAFVGGFTLAFLAGGAGMLSTADRPWRSRLPGPVAAVVTGALAAALLVIAVSALVLAAALLRGFGTAANVLAGMNVGTVGALSYTVVVACLAPNAVLLTGSYLLGPGFHLGIGTAVSPTAVSLGPVPAFPLLAALPGQGQAPWWVMLLMGVPVLASAAAAVLMVRRHPVPGFEVGALRGLAAGVGGGLIVAVLTSLAGGSVGPARMSDVGASLGQLLPAAVLSMGLGGLLGGLLGTWWQRRE